MPFMSRGPTVEGVPIKEQPFWDGVRQSFVKWSAESPLSKCRHKSRPQCVKSRNAGPQQMSKHGIDEVYGFLGMWLRQRADHTDKKAHMKYNPTALEVEIYVREQGWID